MEKAACFIKSAYIGNPIIANANIFNKYFSLSPNAYIASLYMLIANNASGFKNIKDNFINMPINLNSVNNAFIKTPKTGKEAKNAAPTAANDNNNEGSKPEKRLIIINANIKAFIKKHWGRYDFKYRRFYLCYAYAIFAAGNKGNGICLNFIIKKII